MSKKLSHLFVSIEGLWYEAWENHAVFEQLLIGDISKNVVHGYRDKGEGTIVESHSIADHEKDSV
jgi:hypothetical protein